ncbi:MAG TPA: N-methylproline demethylase [Gammaproteobacteria bacterium]|nr:N-methylproline demethylase [Gammaproteobacteria bacterium]
MNAKTDPLLQPLQLKHLTLKNRVMSTSHEPAYSEGGLPKERYQLYHEEKAKGGIGLTMFGGGTLVARDSPAAYGNLYAGDDAIVPHFRELARRVHAHGAATMCQITHLGRRTSNYGGDWLPVIAPSAVREPAHRAFPKAMEDWDIKRTVKAYGAAAARCRDGDLDGIEVFADGHLLDSFWTPAVNRRTDEYGGSLENRVRFSVEVLEEIRRQAGDDFIVGIRMMFDEALDGGLQFDEGLRIGELLAETGLIDFFNINRGHCSTSVGLAALIPNMGTPQAPHLQFAAEVKQHFDLPVMHAARINDVATARYAIQEGLLDLVSMTRAHIADPHIVAKITRGEEDQIRPCVGMGYCIDRIYGEGEALCAHNPATGREGTLPHVITKSGDSPQKVVVVGAGPAGLEAARVCASCGHEVTILEASSLHGGQVNLAAKLQRRREILGITDWLFDQCERLGVKLQFNCYAEVQTVIDVSPDIVLVATGGLPHAGYLKEGEEHATSSWDVLSGSVPIGKNVLFFDDNAQHAGMTTAEFLAQSGCTLEYLSPEMMIAPDIGGSNHPAYLRSLYENGVTITLNQKLTGITREDDGLSATVYNEYTDSNSTRRFDQIICDSGTLPADELYFELKANSINLGEVDQDALLAGERQHQVNNPDGSYRLFRVGDAGASRKIHAAILDSLRLCAVF